MSIKIYDAYRTIYSVHELINVFHEKRKKVFICAVNQLYYNIDSILGESDNKSSINNKYTLKLFLKNHIIESNGRSTYSSFGTDFEQSASIYFPTKKMKKYRNNIFFRLHINYFTYLYKQREIFNMLKDDSIFDFHYQNQTDPPEDVTYSEYKQRKKIWEELLYSKIGSYTSYLNGLQYNFLSSSDAYDIADIASEIYYKNNFEIDGKTRKLVSNTNSITNLINFHIKNKGLF